jgi:hypothetical protein
MLSAMLLIYFVYFILFSGTVFMCIPTSCYIEAWVNRLLNNLITKAFSRKESLYWTYSNTVYTVLSLIKTVYYNLGQHSGTKIVIYLGVAKSSIT